MVRVCAGRWRSGSGDQLEDLPGEEPVARLRPSRPEGASRCKEKEKCFSLEKKLHALCRARTCCWPRNGAFAGQSGPFITGFLNHFAPALPALLRPARSPGPSSSARTLVRLSLLTLLAPLPVRTEIRFYLQSRLCLLRPVCQAVCKPVATVCTSSRSQGSWPGCAAHFAHPPWTNCRLDLLRATCTPHSPPPSPPSICLFSIFLLLLLLLLLFLSPCFRCFLRRLRHVARASFPRRRARHALNLNLLRRGLADPRRRKRRKQENKRKQLQLHISGVRLRLTFRSASGRRSGLCWPFT